ncbi:MAG: hypothetical protein LC772_05150 [Chloroflexi bacterium]|nr:hypothetical protein [Chloroflexota bacterium]
MQKTWGTAMNGMQLDFPDAATLSRDDGWWSLYDASFPDCERESPEVILASLRSGMGFALRARNDDETAALAAAHLLLDPAAVFLVYLATAPAEQGRGIGGWMLEQAWLEGQRRLQSRGLRAQGMVWEVEDPALARTEEDRLERERRLQFFERRGGLLLPHHYEQPPVNGIEPVPLRLMVRRGSASDTLDSAALIRAIYTEKYGAVNGISGEMLGQLIERCERQNSHCPRECW